MGIKVYKYLFINIANVLLIAMILINIIPAGTLKVQALDVRGEGIDHKEEYSTYSTPLTTKKVYIPITIGDDAGSFLQPVEAIIGWDYQAVIAATVAVHRTSLVDDNGNVVFTIVDAAAGGKYKEASIMCDSGINYCVEYEIADSFLKFVSAKAMRFSATLEIYVEASTKAEAEAKVSAILGFFGASFSIVSTVKVGSLYKVEVSIDFYKQYSYTIYEAYIYAYEIVNGTISDIDVKFVEASPLITGLTF